MTKSFKLLFFLSLFSFVALSNPVFQKLNPESDWNCPSWDISRFDQVQYYFTVGVENATSHGFDYEFPISREGVDTVFCSLSDSAYQSMGNCPRLIDYGAERPFQKYEGYEPQLTEYFYNLEEEYTYFQSYVSEWLNIDQADYFNVGSVLEYLSRFHLQELYQIFPTESYTITGGVTYRHGGGHTLGELDIIVYDNNTCDVVAIGESKASSKKSMRRSLRKAKSQLQRIQNFISDYLGR